MKKIHGERAWLIQAIYQETGPDNYLFKALWVGAKECVKAVNAALSGFRDHLLLEDGLELGIKSYREKRFIFQRVDNNYFVGGVIVPDDLKNVVAGTRKEQLLDQAFQIFSREAPYPLLREWMPRLWEACVDEDRIFPLQKLGLEGEVYYVEPPYGGLMREMLLAYLPEFRSRAVELIQ